MTYYKIQFSLDKKEVGDFPQIRELKKGYNSTKKESCSQISRYYFGIKPDVQIDFDCLELSIKAKLTDLLSSSYLNMLTGLLISRKVYDYFLSLRVPEHICYSALVYQKDQIIADNYLWMHFTGNYSQIIDFSKSQFYLDHSDANYQILKIKSLSDFEAMQSRSSYKINARQLYLKKDIALQFDIMRLGIVRNDIFITDAVRQEMIARGFSGITYEYVDYLIVE